MLQVTESRGAPGVRPCVPDGPAEACNPQCFTNGMGSARWAGWGPVYPAPAPTRYPPPATTSGPGNRRKRGPMAPQGAILGVARTSRLVKTGRESGSTEQEVRRSALHRSSTPRRTQRFLSSARKKRTRDDACQMRPSASDGGLEARHRRALSCSRRPAGPRPAVPADSVGRPAGRPSHSCRSAQPAQRPAASSRPGGRRPHGSTRREGYGMPPRTSAPPGPLGQVPGGQRPPAASSSSKSAQVAQRPLALSGPPGPRPHGITPRRGKRRLYLTGRSPYLAEISDFR